MDTPELPDFTQLACATTPKLAGAVLMQYQANARWMKAIDHLSHEDEARAASSEQPSEEQPSSTPLRCSTGVLTRAMYFVQLFS